MTYSPTGRSPKHSRAINVMDLPQETALVRELRRLQKFLEHEQKRDGFPHAIEVRQTNPGPDIRDGTERRSLPKKGNGAIDRLLRTLGLSRRNPARKPSLRNKPGARARECPRPDPKLPLRRWREEKRDRISAPPSATAKAQGGPGRVSAACHRSEKQLWRPSVLDRIVTASPAGVRNALSPESVSMLEFLRPARVFEHLRSACKFLLGRGKTVDLEGTESRFTTLLSSALDGELKAGLRVLIFGVGILAIWATLMPLSGAVVVPGTLVVESDVKKIQHPAGGVVANISVRNGMHVRAGDLLLHLDETQPRANAQVLTQQLDQMHVRLARLIAERDGLDQPQMPYELAGRSGADDVSRLWASEVSLFNSRAAARRSAKELLRSRARQLEEQISGLDSQVKSKAAQHDLISSELEGVDGLYRKGLVPLTRKTSLQREAARLDGERGQVVAAIAEAKSKISEAELQANKVDEDFRTEVMKDLRESQDKAAELVEKSAAAQDLLKRVDLRAPTNGIVHQLSVHTIGGVITPGEVVMEIVPESDELQIEAKLPPQEIDHVLRGQRAYARFSAFNQRTTPQLEGVVTYVSADLTRDRQANANAAYYTVRVTLPPSERRRLGSLKLVSGMPVEVFLQTGSRTMMSYLLKPITDQLLRTFN
jgi:HlyD family secretion protein